VKKWVRQLCNVKLRPGCAGARGWRESERRYQDFTKNQKQQLKRKDIERKRTEEDDENLVK